MNTIKNIHKISGLLSPDDLFKLNAGANQHLKHSNIAFKILSVSDNDITIQTAQGKSFSENYTDAKTLIERTKQLFGQFFKQDIHVHAVSHVDAPVEIVTHDWINKQMLANRIKLKDIVNDTGIDKANISGYINALRPMSQPVKAMFYYYFESKK